MRETLLFQDILVLDIREETFSLSPNIGSTYKHSHVHVHADLHSNAYSQTFAHTHTETNRNRCKHSKQMLEKPFSKNTPYISLIEKSRNDMIEIPDLRV